MLASAALRVVGWWVGALVALRASGGVLTLIGGTHDVAPV